MPQIAWQDKLVSLPWIVWQPITGLSTWVGPEKYRGHSGKPCAGQFSARGHACAAAAAGKSAGPDWGAVGPAFPGIPLRMIWQPGKYTTIEQRRKRGAFPENVLAELHLPGTGVFAGDA